MDKQDQEEIINSLKSKGAVQPCPRCSNLEFEIIGETSIGVSNRARRVWGQIGPSEFQVPVIIASCTRCGYLAQHAKRLLDLKS
jgi:ribosomal protein S27AE